MLSTFCQSRYILICHFTKIEFTIFYLLNESATYKDITINFSNHSSYQHCQVFKNFQKVYSQSLLPVLLRRKLRRSPMKSLWYSYNNCSFASRIPKIPIVSFKLWLLLPKKKQENFPCNVVLVYSVERGE